MEELVSLLHEGNHSLVVANGDICTFNGRGVSDLYGLFKGNPGFLKGASIADKVVGKAAAALMISGGVKRVFTDIVSRPALDLFAASKVHVSYGIVVPHIVNRTKTGWCPLETRCRNCLTPQECIEQIEEFIELQANK